MRGVRLGLFVGWVLTGAAVIAADLLAPADWDWVELPFSRYSNTEHGWLVVAAILGTAVMALLGIVALRPVWARHKAVLWLLAAAFVAITIAGLVHADPPGHYMNPSLSEAVHGVSGWVGFLTFPAVAWLTAKSVERHRTLLRVLTVVATLLTVAIVAIWLKQMETIRAFPWGAHQSTLGIVERALFWVDGLTLAVSGLAAAHPLREVASR